MYIKVRVTPGAKTETITRKAADHIVMSIREKAEYNLANRRVMELVARLHNVPVGCVRIINGHHSRSKILSVDL